MPYPKKSLHLAPVWNSFHTFSQDENWGLFSFEWFFLRECKNPNYWASLDWVLNTNIQPWFLHTQLWFDLLPLPGFSETLEHLPGCLKSLWVFAILCKASVMFAAIRPGLEAHTDGSKFTLMRRWWHLGCCGWNFWVQLTSLAGWGERRAGLLLWGSLQLEEKETPVAVRWKLVLNILWD